MKRLLAFLLLLTLPAAAHEARPGYLDLRETTPGHYEATWKQPANGEYAIRMGPSFPPDCTLGASRDTTLIPGALLARFSLACPGGLAGRAVTIAGLETTLTDVLVRLTRADGGQEAHLARPIAATVTFNGGGLLSQAGVYLGLGLRHILMGLDHLLFVLGLVMIVRGRWRLLKTVTAFTAAHSLTLAAATLGVARAPAPPLNFAIALSILFLGPEMLRAARGQRSLTIDRPWLVAFAFGLLHGFGFATGLTAMGLPRAEITGALVLFNTGVELGQLGFVALLLALARAFRLLQIAWPAPLRALPAYLVGTLGAMWSLQRLALMLTVAP